MPALQEAIKVMARIRPPQSYLFYPLVNQPNVMFLDKKDQKSNQKHYKFDHIFPSYSTNKEVFETVGQQLVMNTLEGYNSTLLAYGHTGSGKTYTMTGRNNDSGLIQMSVRKIIEHQNNYQQFCIKMSYLEIYNQIIKDLLSQKIKTVTVRQSLQLGFYVQNLDQFIINTYQQFQTIFKIALQKRNQKSTMANLQSSRSHAILTLVVETKQTINGSTVMKSSKLNFVDLAGAENIKQTGAGGDRKLQAANINGSLGVLSKIITTLSNTKNRKAIHIPYRQSNLTKILKDSLGGNSHTIIIGTVYYNSNDQFNLSNNFNTLQFLNRAKQVKNEKKVNQKFEGNEDRLKDQLLTNQKKIKQYQNQISWLKQQVMQLKKKLEDSQVDRQIKQKQIQKLHDHIVQFQALNSFFEQQKQFQFGDYQQLRQHNNYSPFANQLEAISQLNTQIENENTEGLTRFNQIKISKGQNVEPKKSKSNISTKSNINNILVLQNNYLKQKVQAYNKQNIGESQLLKIIAQNIQNLKFRQAQLNILQAQSRQLQFYRQRLDKAEKYKDEVFEQCEQIKKQIQKMKRIEIDSISQQSIYQVQKNKNSKQIAQLTSKIQTLTFQNQKLQENMKIQLFKKNAQLAEKSRQRQQLQYQYQMLKDQYTQYSQQMKQLFQKYEISKQQQIQELQQKNQYHKEQMLKNIEKIQYHSTKSIKQKQLKIRQLEYTIKDIYEDKEESEQIMDQLVEIAKKQLHKLEDKKVLLKEQISQKQQIIQQLQIQMQSLKQKNSQIVKQHQQLLKAFEQKQNILNEYQSNFKSIFKISVGQQQQITISQLEQKYYQIINSEKLLKQQIQCYKKQAIQLKSSLDNKTSQCKVYNRIALQSTNLYKKQIMQRQNQITNANNQLEILRQKNENIMRQNQRLTSQNQKGQKDTVLISLQKQVEWKNKQNEQLKNKINVYHKKFNQLKKHALEQIQNFYRQFLIKNALNQKLTQQNKQLTKQLQASKQQIQRYKKYQMLQFEIKRIQEINISHQSRIRQLTVRNSQLFTLNNKLKEQKGVIRAKLKQKNQQNMRMKILIQQQRMQNIRSSLQINSIRSELVRITNEFNTLKNDKSIQMSNLKTHKRSQKKQQKRNKSVQFQFLFD